MNEPGNTLHFCAETVPAFRPVGLSVNRRRGFVYFATDGVMIKIGHSRVPKHRMGELRSPTKAGPLRLIAYFPGYMDEEHNVHRFFAELLVHGAEWFQPDQRIDDLIAALTAHSEPLCSGLISINDVIFGRAIEILDIRDKTKADLEKWIDKECHKWPAEVQVKGAKTYYALKGQFGDFKECFEEFKSAYRQWAGLAA